MTAPRIPDDPLAGYSPDWRQRADPLEGYSPDWRKLTVQRGLDALTRTLEGRSTTAPSDATRQAPAGADLTKPLPARIVEGVAGFGQAIKEDPLGVAKQIVTDPIVSAGRALNAPVVGERVSTARALRGKAGPLPGTLRAGTVISKENTPGAITPEEMRLGGVQTVANVAAGGAFGPIRSALRARGAGKLASTAATGGVTGAPVGAAYSPEDPLAGAGVAGLFGAALGPAVEGAAPTVGRAARATAEGVSRAAAATGRAAERAAGVVGDAPSRVSAAVQAMRRKAAETIDPTIGESIRMAEERRATAERAAQHDELTGLANQKAYLLAKQAAEADPATAIVRFDLDGFKAVNDKLSHEAGDAVLREVGEVMRQAADEVGAAAERTFRVGGDEFAALVPAELADDFRARVEELYGVRDHAPGVRTAVSGGVGLTDQLADQAAIARKAARKAELNIAERPGTPRQQAVKPTTSVATMPTAEIAVDPERFQFKATSDPVTGTGAELKTVNVWNPDLAGVIAVWRDPADGQTYVVNGHHRVELAKRLGVPAVDVRFIEAADALEARAKGALINIAEGRGTAVDGAKFLRDTGRGLDDLAAAGVSARGAVARDAVALATLSPDLFDRVASGQIEAPTAAAIARVLDAPEQQRAALALIERRGQRLTEAQATELAKIVRDAGSETLTQETLFGTEETALSLAVDKARLIDAVRKDIAADKRLFGFVAREGRAEGLARGGNIINVEESAKLAGDAARVGELFDRVANRSGPISDLLTEGARRLANGESIAAVRADLTPRIREALPAALAGDLPGALGGAADDVRGGRPEAGPERDELGPGAETPEPEFVDPNQSALFEPDLFGNATPDEIAAAQGGLFGGQEGTAASRSLAQTEAAARARLARLRQELDLTTDPAKRKQLAREILEHERLVNRGQAIGPEELRTRALAADEPPPPDVPGQGTLFAPADPAPTMLSAPATTTAGGFGAKYRRAAKIPQSTATDLKTLRQISLDLANAVGVPLHQGRGNLRKMLARGAFWVREESIRVQRLKMVDTVAHEIGHYVSKKYDIKGPVGAALRNKAGHLARQKKQTMGAELWQMGKNLYGNRKPAGGYAEEGVAEFFKFWVTDRPRAAREAPMFTAWAERMLDREPLLKAALDEAHVDWTRFQAAPANEKIRSMIASKPPSRLRVTPARLVEELFNDMEPVHRAMKALGGSADITTDAGILAELTKGNAGRARDMVKHGVVDFRTRQRLTRGLEEILAEIPHDQLGDFTEYWVSRQVLTKTGQGVDTGFDVPAAKDIVNGVHQDQARAAAYQRWAQDLWDYRSALLDYLESSGLLETGKAAQIRQHNPTPTPFYRHFEADENVGSGGHGRALARNAAPVQKMRGSDRPIVNPLESLIADTYKMVDLAQRHHAAATLVKLAISTEGGARVAELLPEPPKMIHTVSKGTAEWQLAAAAKRLGLGGLDDVNIALIDAMGVSLDAILSESGGFWQEKLKGFIGAPERKDMVMPLLLNGERRWVQINDPALWRAMQGMVIPELSLLERALSAPTRTLRMGATQVNPDFALVNPFRDAFPAAIYSKGGSRPPFWHLARGIFHLVRDKAGSPDALATRWMQEGGAHSGISGVDRRAIAAEYQATLKDLTANRRTALARAILHPVRSARRMFELLENATRLGEMAEVREARMREGVAELPATMEGTYAARNVTVDFFKAGRSARAVNRYVAFFTAHLGDIRKFAEEHNPVKWRTPEGRKRMATVSARATAWITAPSIALYLLQKDDPVYQEIPEYYKANAWIIVDRENGPIPFTLQSGETVRVWAFPRPFLLGYVYGYIPEKSLAWLNDKDPRALEDMAAQSWSMLVPSWIPTVVGPLVENYANKSTFTGRPIVPREVEGLEPSQQASKYTGETARTLGEVFDYPPAKIENVIRGYTGGAGMMVTGAADAAIRTGREAAGLPPMRPVVPGQMDPLDRAPVIGRFVLSQPGAGAQSVSELYDAFEEAERKRLTFKRLLAKGQQREAAEYLERNREEIASVLTDEDSGGTGPGKLRAFHDMLGDLAEGRRLLHTLVLPEEERQRRLFALEQQAVELARRYWGRTPARPSAPDRAARAVEVFRQRQTAGVP